MELREAELVPWFPAALASVSRDLAAGLMSEADGSCHRGPGSAHLVEGEQLLSSTNTV